MTEITAAARAQIQSSKSSSSLLTSTSNSSLSDTFNYEEPNSFNSSILQRDVTQACRISASSSKAGHSAENLRVTRLQDVSKLWQSDGLAPHTVTIELSRQSLLSVHKYHYIEYLILLGTSFLY